MKEKRKYTLSITEMMIHTFNKRYNTANMMIKLKCLALIHCVVWLFNETLDPYNLTIQLNVFIPKIYNKSTGKNANDC